MTTPPVIDPSPRLKRLALLILAVYIVLAIVYSVVTPVFEAPDENYHFAFIQRLAQSWDLPVQDPAITTPWFQEGSQPPLYYFAASVVIRLTGVPYQPYPLKVNPHAEIGIGLAPINHNFFIHTADEAFPWSGVALAVHLVRFLSIGLGVITIWAVYKTACLALPDLPGVALAAMAFTALNPMFLFMTGSINNDNLVTALAASVLWVVLALVRDGYSIRRVGLLGLLLALASLSKLSGLTLYAPAGLGLIILLVKRRLTWRQVLISGLTLAGLFVLIAGWWYLRNWQLYVDPTGLKAMIAIIEPRKTPYTWLTMLNEMQGLRISTWALFGWFNVIGPNWFLLLMDGLTALAVLGGVLWLAREIRSRRFDSLVPLGLLGVQFAVTFISLINWTRLTPGTQGRLLFPALPATATLTALGWYALGGKFGRWSAGLPLLVMLGVATISPLVTILPAYAPPPTVDRLPDGAVAVDVRFDKITVVGFRVGQDPVRQGSVLPVTVFYRGEPDPRNLSLYLTALDTHGIPVGKVDSYPGGGNLPTSSLQAGRIYADTYLIPIGAPLDTPMQGKIEFGWWDYATKTRISPVKGDGTALDALILRGGTLLASVQPAPPVTAQTATFGAAVALRGYTLSQPDGIVHPGDSLDVRLVWEGLKPIHEDFTVFVQLVADGQNQPLAQGDSPPAGGEYPTSAWAVNQPFTDSHPILIAPGKVPPGTYHLVIGLYRPGDGTRLPLESGGDSLVLQTPIVVK